MGLNNMGFRFRGNDGKVKNDGKGIERNEDGGNKRSRLTMKMGMNSRNGKAAMNCSAPYYHIINDCC